MGKLLTSPLMMAATESVSGLPVDLRWLTVGLTLACIAFFVAVPIYIKSQIESKFEQQIRRSREALHLKAKR